MAEWRVEVLWRLDADSLDNGTLVAVADAADEKDWLVSRWEDGPGFYVTGYVEATTAAEAAALLHDQVSTWMEGTALVGCLASVEALQLDIAEIRANKPTVPELASAADAAEILEISRQRVHQLATSNPRFPKPVTRVATGPLWTKDSIRWFNSVWERRPGRPAKPEHPRVRKATRSAVTSIRAAAGYGRRMADDKASESKALHQSMADKRTK
ncbi:MAG TPA: hypothetical protein VF444_15600 [Pseudonocardiaceae bacterium]